MDGDGSTAAPRTVPARKDEHLRLAAEGDVGARHRATGFDALHFDHRALPELDLEQIDTSLTLFGKPLRAPVLIGAMTGGTERAAAINEMLAEAAAACGVGMGLGSQRAMLEDPARARYFRPTVRPPLLIGNLGAVQLNYGVTTADVCRLAEGSQVDALALHLNPLQEAIQLEGDTRFSGLLSKIEEVARELPIPLIVKEVGAGIGAHVARQLASAGVAAIDVAGVGGTSWAALEGLRAGENATRAQLGEIFRDFGIPTARCLRECRAALPELPLIASGGIRHGLDGAKALALGASAFALSRPLLLASASGAGAVATAIDTVVAALRVVMFCTGSPDLEALRSRELREDR